MNGETKKAKLYNGKIEIEFSPDSHRYYINGEPAPYSVSSIVGVLDKPALVGWAVRETISRVETQFKDLMTLRNFIGNLNFNPPAEITNLEEVLPEALLLPEVVKAGILSLASGEHIRKRDEAADEGTRVHALLEAWIKQGMGGNGSFNVTEASVRTLAEKTSHDENLARSVRQMGNWLMARDASFLSAERILYSRRHQYPGMMDAKMVLRNRKNQTFHVVDFKIRSGVYEETRLQTAAYQHAAEEESSYVSKDTEEKFDSRWVFRIGRKDGKFTGDFEPIEYKKLRADFKAFLNCLEILKWKKSITSR